MAEKTIMYTCQTPCTHLAPCPPAPAPSQAPHVPRAVPVPSAPIKQAEAAGDVAGVVRRAPVAGGTVLAPALRKSGFMFFFFLLVSFVPKKSCLPFRHIAK